MQQTNKVNKLTIRQYTTQVCKAQSFYDTSVWCQYFSNWRDSQLENTVVDASHTLQHLVIDTFEIIGQPKDSSMGFTKARREEEQKLGRFTAPGKVSI